MKRVADGDANAMRALFERHAPSMLGIAARLLHDRHDAEELVNEVFLELWQKADQFTQDRGSVQTYLLLLTRSRSIDRIRSMNRKSAGGDHIVQRLPDASVVDVGDSPHASAERTELRSIVKSELADLPEQQRHLLDLAFFGGMTHKQIAERVNEPLGTIKGRLRRAMLHLRDRLHARLNPGETRSSDGDSDTDGAAAGPTKEKGGGE
ncbi:MAG: sigma-70 family RNA polymerase sigma factor [Planctomycetota bacterium]